MYPIVYEIEIVDRAKRLKRIMPRLIRIVYQENVTISRSITSTFFYLEMQDIPMQVSIN